MPSATTATDDYAAYDKYMKSVTGSGGSNLCFDGPDDPDGKGMRCVNDCYGCLFYDETSVLDSATNQEVPCNTWCSPLCDEFKDTCSFIFGSGGYTDDFSFEGRDDDYFIFMQSEQDNGLSAKLTVAVKTIEKEKKDAGEEWDKLTTHLNGTNLECTPPSIALPNGTHVGSCGREIDLCLSLRDCRSAMNIEKADRDETYFGITGVQPLVRCLEQLCLVDDRVRAEVGCGVGLAPYYTVHSYTGECRKGFICQGGEEELTGLVVCDQFPDCTDGSDEAYVHIFHQNNRPENACYPCLIRRYAVHSTQLFLLLFANHTLNTPPHFSSFFSFPSFGIMEDGTCIPFKKHEQDQIPHTVPSLATRSFTEWRACF